MGAMACQITSFTIVYSAVYSAVDQGKHQSSTSLAFVRGIHRWPVNSPHKWPVTRKIFPFDDVIMMTVIFISICLLQLTVLYIWSNLCFCHITITRLEVIGPFRNCMIAFLMLCHHLHQGHDDVIKWKYFPRYWPFVRRIHLSPVKSPHKDQ